MEAAMNDRVQISEVLTHKRSTTIEISASELEMMLIQHARKVAGLPSIEMVRDKHTRHEIEIEFKLEGRTIDNAIWPMEATVVITEDLAAAERARRKPVSEL
jgi:hypothetical protein